MGGGVCWLDYNNDGWLDLFAVNSLRRRRHAASGEAHGGLPQSALFQNVHGKFVERHGARRTPASGSKGTGCVAADLNGDGYTDLVVTTATGVELLWNNGNGTLHARARARTGSPVRLVLERVGRGRERRRPARPLRRRLHEHGRPRSPSSIAGFPTNYQGVRDLLYLNEGNGPDGRARFKEVGVEGGPRVVALPPRPRRDLHRRERRRPPRSLRRERRGSERALHQRARRPARLPLRRRGEGVRRRRPERRAWASPRATSTATAVRISSSRTHAARRTPPTRARSSPGGETGVRARDDEVRDGARPQGDGRLGRLVRRPRQRRQAPT